MQILDPESTLVKYSAYEYVLLASWKYFDKVLLIVQFSDARTNKARLD